MTCCIYSIDDIIRNLHNNVELQALVGEYKTFPAIANNFSETPDVAFITFCELRQPDYQETSDGCILGGYVDFDVKIVMDAKCTSRAETRGLYNDMYCILKNYTDEQVAKVVYRDSSGIMYMGERPYISATFRFILR